MKTEKTIDFKNVIEVKDGGRYSNGKFGFSFGFVSYPLHGKAGGQIMQLFPVIVGRVIDTDGVDYPEQELHKYTAIFVNLYTNFTVGKLFTFTNKRDFDNRSPVCCYIEREDLKQILEPDVDFSRIDLKNSFEDNSLNKAI